VAHIAPGAERADGYYRVENEEQLKATLNDYKKRAFTLFAEVNVLRKNFGRTEVSPQLNLFEL